MHTSRVSEPASSRARSNRVRPANVRKALSWPIRVLWPPAATKAVKTILLSGRENGVKCTPILQVAVNRYGPGIIGHGHSHGGPSDTGFSSVLASWGQCFLFEDSLGA